MTASRGIYRCGDCGELGHTRRNLTACTRKRPRRVHPSYSAANASYQRNRALGICDDCGRRWKRSSRCPDCTRRRNARPARQWAHRKSRGRKS